MITITGLSDNYYLAKNDIWIKVSAPNDEPNALSYVELIATNMTTGVALPAFRFSPSPSNEISFNISQIVLVLFQKINHLSINTLQSFRFEFYGIYIDTENDDDFVLVEKYFVYGKKAKNKDEKWNLTDGTELLIKPWIEWSDILLPSNPLKINGSALELFAPTLKYRINRSLTCAYKILKFRNSLGGYQFFVFENFELKDQSKAGKTIDKIRYQLQDEGFDNLENSTETEITFFAKVPFQIQNVFSDLVRSNEVYIFNPNGSPADSSGWYKLKIENNKSIQNNWDRSYENEITFTFEDNVNIETDFAFGTGGGNSGSNGPNNNFMQGGFIDITQDY